MALYGWTNGNVESGSNNSGWKGREDKRKPPLILVDKFLSFLDRPRGPINKERNRYLCGSGATIILKLSIKRVSPMKNVYAKDKKKGGSIEEAMIHATTISRSERKKTAFITR